MREAVKKFETALAKIQRIFFCTTLGFLAIVMFAAVVFRYVLKDPIIWSEEVTANLQGALAFAGIGYCFYYGAHTRVLILHDRLPRWAQLFCDLLCDGIMIYCMFKFLETMPKYIKSKSAFLTTLRWLNYDVFNYVIYVGFALGIIYVLLSAYHTICGYLDEKRAAETAG